LATFVDTAGDLGGDLDLRYYFITTVDASGNESTPPPIAP
jgi:hypothetical protein